MAEAKEYKTRQRQCILDCLFQNSGRHITVEEIADVLKAQGETVGKTTIYRYVEKLVKEGAVRKFVLPEGACFQYARGGECREHFHLKCVECGKLIHLECDYLRELQAHILREHRFYISAERTVFYGRCEDCAKKEGKNETL